MERLWTPWRLAYVTAASKDAPGCVFCQALATGADESLIVFRGTACFVILNLYPYNNGHLMVVPMRHVGRLSGLEPDEAGEMMRLTRVVEMALQELYQPHGFNMGLNLGKSAGAGVLDHLHMHVVPRWNGDTNFMTVVGDTRVLPEDLARTAERLRPILSRLAHSV
ncbi:MAG: HIT domain-containing protein [Acidobacteria bacterium]|nr:HIT domain-containing protein [Acidobacteriota bacterium]